MAGAIYKSGQGYWVRLMSAISFGVIVALGLTWLWDWLDTISFGDVETAYVQVGAVLVVGITVGGLGYYLIGSKRRTVDFFIATEGEMKKVNWSSRKELQRSTWAVIALTMFIAFYCFLLDRVFYILFWWLGVLDASSSG